MTAAIEPIAFRSISSVELADVLANMVTADIQADAERFGNVTTWTDLHGVCDANEYLIEATEHFFGGQTWEYDEAVLAWENDAVAIAETVLWPKGVG